MTRPEVTDQELLAFAAGELPEAEASRIAARIDADPDAARRAAMYRLAARRTVEDDSQEPPAATAERARAIFAQMTTTPATGRPRLGWLDQLEAVVARLVYDSRLQPAAVRGIGPDRFQLSYETEDAGIDLQFERAAGVAEAAETVRWKVMGQVSGPPAPTGIEVAVAAARAADPVAVTDADDTAMFRFDLDPGTYDLRVRTSETTILLTDIRVG